MPLFSLHAWHVHSEKISESKTEDFCFEVTDELITSKTVGRDGVSSKQG